MENPSQKTSSLLLPATLTEGLYLVRTYVHVCMHQCLNVCVFGYRHSETMIRKLRSAGLGFYVTETETRQKLGE